MVDVQAVWGECVPEIKGAVTGMGIWTALNIAQPIAFENDTLVLGIPASDSELAGHLRVHQNKRLIETIFQKKISAAKVDLRIIAGTTAADWETEKRRDLEKRRIQEQAMVRQRAEILAGKSWETVYEQISRKHAATPNRSMPQNRARFFLEAVDIVAEALLEAPINDDLAERNYARCLERIATYCELPSAFVALKVLEKSFSG